MLYAVRKTSSWCSRNRSSISWSPGFSVTLETAPIAMPSSLPGRRKRSRFVTGLFGGRRGSGQARLARPRDMVGRLLVLVADELDHLLVDPELLIHADRERLRVCL